MDPLDVLVVEDNQADLEIIRRYLNEVDRNVNLRHRKTARGAKSVIHDESPDLVMVDHLLPRKSGLEFLSEFQNHDVYLPVIMITGEGDESLLSHSLRQGADDYISKKNLSPGILEHSIDYVLETSREQFERDLKILEVEYVGESNLDLLTGLHNRDALVERLRTDLRRYDDDESKGVSLTLLDIDGFRRVNDHKGFLAGDELLKQVASVLSARADEEDFVGRYGSDEFCLISPIECRTEASERAKKVREGLAGMMDYWTNEHNLSFSLTVSFGITICVSRVDDPHHHFNCVQQDLRQAKATADRSLDGNGVIS